ncbi:hypothetical protein [Fusibacter sp. JL216-2]|uniref:hypothetical protein n=1 Tax=Fusibacter sp. JL216-2 TaxID=3071453 RepID=UPI003D327780
MNHYFGQEWELLDDELLLTRYVNIAGIELNDFSVKISIKRNSEYRIVGTLTGLNLNDVIDKYQSMQTGDVIQSISIRGWDENGGGVYELPEVYFGEIINTISIGEKTESIIELNIRNIRSEAKNEGNVSVVKDWFINAPNHTYLLNEYSDRKDERVVEITRGEYKSSYFLKKVSGSPCNFMSFNINDWDIYVEKCIVIDRNDINEFRPLSVTYVSKTDNSQLNEEIRTSVSSVLSLYLGKPLIQVGSSYLNSKSEILLLESINPIFPTDRKFLSIEEEIFIGDPYPLNEKYKLVENFKESLLKFVELRKKTRIDELLWRYWISRDHFISLQLPTLVSGLEIFIKSYMESIEQTYIPNDDFKLIYDYISEHIESNYNELKDIDVVLSKIKGSNRVSIGKTYEQFFITLGLEFSPKIKKAIGARNALIHHGMSKKSGSEYKTINNLLIVRTTINRIVLKLLDYRGGYIDHSSRGFELRRIEDY